MDRNRAVRIAAACLVGLAVSTGYLFKIHRVRDQMEGLERTLEVVVARHPLDIGETVLEEMLSVKRFPTAHLSRRAMTSEDLQLILGQSLVHPIPEGDLILWSDLSDGPRLRYPTERIPEGYRSFALAADEIHTQIHLLSPGDRVDVIWTHFPSGGSKPESRILAEALPVMAVGRLLEINNFPDRLEEIPASLTLLVTEAQAIELSCAVASGELTLLARGRGSTGPSVGETTQGMPVTGDRRALR